MIKVYITKTAVSCAINWMHKYNLWWLIQLNKIKTFPRRIQSCVSWTLCWVRGTSLIRSLHKMQPSPSSSSLGDLSSIPSCLSSWCQQDSWAVFKVLLFWTLTRTTKTPSATSHSQRGGKNKPWTKGLKSDPEDNCTFFRLQIVLIPCRKMVSVVDRVVFVFFVTAQVGITVVMKYPCRTLGFNMEVFYYLIPGS